MLDVRDGADTAGTKRVYRCRETHPGQRRRVRERRLPRSTTFSPTASASSSWRLSAETISANLGWSATATWVKAPAEQGRKPAMSAADAETSARSRSVGRVRCADRSSAKPAAGSYRTTRRRSASLACARFLGAFDPTRCRQASRGGRRPPGFLLTELRPLRTLRDVPAAVSRNRDVRRPR